MKKKFFILLFIIIFIFISLLYFNNKNGKENAFTHLFLVQYLPLKNPTGHYNFSLPLKSTPTIAPKKIFQEEKSDPYSQKQKSFFSISTCSPLGNKPDSLSKKFNKNQTNQPVENKYQLFEKFDCGLIQTIIPLSF